MHLSERRGSQTIIWRPSYHHDCFLGYECEPASRGSSGSLSGLHSPHPLPAECCKGQPRKGVGDDATRQPYCHTLSGVCVCVFDFSLFSKGEMLSVFFHFVFFVSGSVSFVVFFRSSLLRVAF